MFKENLDTAAALAILQRMLRCGKGTLAVAGNKDKRGVTSQHVTAYQARSQPTAPITPQICLSIGACQGDKSVELLFTRYGCCILQVYLLPHAQRLHQQQHRLKRQKEICCAQQYRHGSERRMLCRCKQSGWQQPMRACATCSWATLSMSRTRCISACCAAIALRSRFGEAAQLLHTARKSSSSGSCGCSDGCYAHSCWQHMSLLSLRHVHVV